MGNIINLLTFMTSSSTITDESLEKYRKSHKYKMEEYIFKYIHQKYIIHPMSVQMWIISSKLHYLLERRPPPTYLLVKGIAKHDHNLIEWIDPVLSTTLLFNKVWFCPDSGKMFCLNSTNGLTIDIKRTSYCYEDITTRLDRLNNSLSKLDFTKLTRRKFYEEYDMSTVHTIDAWYYRLLYNLNMCESNTIQQFINKLSNMKEKSSSKYAKILISITENIGNKLLNIQKKECDKLNTNFLNANRIVLGNKFNHMFYSKICEKFTQEQIKNSEHLPYLFILYAKTFNIIRDVPRPKKVWFSKYNITVKNKYSKNWKTCICPNHYLDNSKYETIIKDIVGIFSRLSNFDVFNIDIKTDEYTVTLCSFGNDKQNTSDTITKIDKIVNKRLRNYINMSIMEDELTELPEFSARDKEMKWIYYDTYRGYEKLIITVCDF